MRHTLYFVFSASILFVMGAYGAVTGEWTFDDATAPLAATVGAKGVAYTTANKSATAAELGLSRHRDDPFGEVIDLPKNGRFRFEVRPMDYCGEKGAPLRIAGGKPTA